MDMEQYVETNSRIEKQKALHHRLNKLITELVDYQIDLDVKIAKLTVANATEEVISTHRDSIEGRIKGVENEIKIVSQLIEEREKINSTTEA